MYFFRDIILILLIVLASLKIYQYLVNINNIGKKNIIFIFLIILHSLFILFGNNMLFFIFLDFSIFLCYLFKMKNQALILSFINILFFNTIFKISFIYYLIYFLYLVGYFIFYKRFYSFIIYLLVLKSFITSFMYFSYFGNNSIDLIYIVFMILYFYSLLQLVYVCISNFEKEKGNENFIFQIVHELKNPFTVCKGYLEMLDVNNSNKLNKYIPIIKSEMNRALVIMDDFLDLKKITVNKDIMDLMLLIEDVNAVMNPVLNSKNIIFKVPNIYDEVLIEADYDRLKQVFINLIKNSSEANSKKIKIDLNVRNDRVVVDIIDDGDGIEKLDLKKVGQLFYTTKINGTGIGVSLSKKIIQLHNGEIRYESKIKKGTKVTLTLPNYISFLN